MAPRNRRRKRQSAERHSEPPEHGPSTDRWRPWLLGAACALFVVRPLFPSESAALAGDGLPIVMLWIAVALFWLLGAALDKRFHVRFGWVDAAIALLVGWHTIAAIWATTRASPRPAVNMLWEWVAYGLSFFLLRQLVVTRREARAVIVMMLALAVALAGYGLYQYYYELPSTRDEYFRDPDKVLREIGMWSPPGSRERELLERRVYGIQPLGTFALANSLAGYLAPWLVLMAGIGTFSLLRRRRQWWRVLKRMAKALLKGRLWLSVRLWFLPAFTWWGRAWGATVGGVALIGTCLLLTGSRSALIAAALGLMWLVVSAFWPQRKSRQHRKRSKLIAVFWVGCVLAVLLAVCVLTLARGHLDVPMIAEAGRSLAFRVQYWQSTLGIIADHLLVGCGPGNFQQTYTHYMLPEASEEVADPHNFVLEVWATAGTPALLALAAVLGLFAHALLRPTGAAGLFGRGDDAMGRPSAGMGRAKGGRTSGDEDPGPRLPQPPAWPAEVAGRSDATRHVLGGAVCGFLLSVPVGRMGVAPPGWMAVGLGLPLAAASAAMLFGWIDRGRLAAGLTAAGIGVLLVHLLAAGGIGFPGVAGTLWLLMAVTLNAVDGSRPHRLPRSAASAGAVSALALAVACSASAFRPVLECRTEMHQAERFLLQARHEAQEGNLTPARRHLLLAEDHLKAAAVADPLAAEPWEQLASLAFDRWRQEHSAEAFERFETCMKTALDLTPNSASAWRTSGDWYRQAFLETGRQDRDIAEKAVSSCREAVQRYPNDAQTRASLALALRASGDQAGFQRQAAIALRLDQIAEEAQHEDKRLDVRLRDELRDGSPRNDPRGN